MNASDVRAGDRVIAVRFADDTMSVDLADGRTITVPLAMYPVLLHASDSQRSHWSVSGAGFGLHWPELDEDLSVEALIRGIPSAGPRKPGAGTG
jgi:hypothetical protein